MSTAATVVDLAVKPVSVTYVNYVVEKQINNADGTVTKETSIKAIGVPDKEDGKRNSVIEEAKKNGTFLSTQSFSFDLPGTVEGIAQLGLSDDVILECFTNGYKAKIQRGIVAAMQEEDAEGNPTFQPVDGNYDARPFGAEAAGRRGLTPMEKAIKTLREALRMLPQDQAEAIIAQSFGAQKSPEAAA